MDVDPHMNPIPFHRPTLAPGQLENVEQALRSGTLAGDGPFGRRAEALLREATGCQTVLLTTSCTHALEMIAILLDAPPGSEVIVPDFSYVSTANAFLTRGLTPVFADIDPDTLNLSPDATRAALTERTVAVVAVHYGGVACDMAALGALCEDHGVTLIEDNAHGLLGSWNERPLGTIGALGALSFHETKNFTCGEGGALMINEEALRERAEIIREKGTDRTRFFRGETNRYTWIDTGSSYVLSDVLASILCAQLEHAGVIQDRRERAWSHYRSALAPWAEAAGVRLLPVPEYATPSHHLMGLLMPDAHGQHALIAHLAERGVAATFHFQPLHASAMGAHLGWQPGACPVSVDAAARLVRLPLHAELSDSDLERVVKAVGEYEA